MHRTRRYTLFFIIAALVLTFSAIHIFAENEADGEIVETNTTEVFTVPDAASMT